MLGSTTAKSAPCRRNRVASVARARIAWTGATVRTGPQCFVHGFIGNPRVLHSCPVRSTGVKPTDKTKRRFSKLPSVGFIPVRFMVLTRLFRCRLSGPSKRGLKRPAATTCHVRDRPRFGLSITNRLRSRRRQELQGKSTRCPGVWKVAANRFTMGLERDSLKVFQKPGPEDPGALRVISPSSAPAHRSGRTVSCCITYRRWR